MSFSSPRDAGSSSAPASRGFVQGPDDGDPYHWLGTLSLTKVRGASTHGQPGYRRPPGAARIRTA